jgi:hypothetical protein
MSDDITTDDTRPTHAPWNKGKLTGPKPPLKTREIWGITIRPQLTGRPRDPALFNLAIDSKVRVGDVAHGGTVTRRAIVLQHMTR